MTIRVLIVDDSATMRALLSVRLAKENDIEVVAAAADAAEARQLIKTLDPDVVTLDIEMPKMDGLSFLEKIMALRPTPVIIVSGATQAGAEATARALALGAVDCYAKGNREGALLDDDGGQLASLIRQAARVRFDTPARARHRLQGRAAQDCKLLAIGSSTGGVEALDHLLRAFPADCPPTLIVQHINANFASAVARRLDEVCPANVVLAESDMVLKRGHVYFAPGGDRHLLVAGQSQWTTKLRAGDPVSGHRPSVDCLFSSVAQTVGADATGILLTGMGSDGARGLLHLRQAGAFTIAQDEASSTVFGMPRAAIDMGAACVVAPLTDIAAHALRKAA